MAHLQSVLYWQAAAWATNGKKPLAQSQNINETYDKNADTYTINYDGTDFTGVKEDGETLQNGWNDDIYTYQLRASFRVPKGYDDTVFSD